jgi:hypothetical protein
MAGLKNFVNRRLRRTTKPIDTNTRFDQTGAAAHYVEQDPTVGEWLREATPSGKQVVDYMSSLFPFSSWIVSILGGLARAVVVILTGFG